MSTCKSQAALIELFSQRLGSFAGEKATRLNQIPTAGNLGSITEFLRFGEKVLRVRQFMDAELRDPNQGQNRDGGFGLTTLGWPGDKKFEDVRKKTLLQKRFRFEDSELAGPFRRGTVEFCIGAASFRSTLCQITMEKILVGSVVVGLR